MIIILFGGLVGLIVFFGMADLIATIGKHRMPFGSYFALDAVEGLLVYFDQFDIHDISV